MMTDESVESLTPFLFPISIFKQFWSMRLSYFSGSVLSSGFLKEKQFSVFFQKSFPLV